MKSLKVDLPDKIESGDRSRACESGVPPGGGTGRIGSWEADLPDDTESADRSRARGSGVPPGGVTGLLRCLTASPSEDERRISSDLGDCLLVDFLAGLPEVCLPEQGIEGRGGGPGDRVLL